MVYRPQGDGKAERTVQTLTRALKIHQPARLRRLCGAADVCAEYGTQSREGRNVVLPSPWMGPAVDTRSGCIGGLHTPSRLRCTETRYHIQGQYGRAREEVNENLRDAIKSRADQHNGNTTPDEEGSQVWLYLYRVKEGCDRKLAHIWHGPFRVTELIGNHAARLEAAGSWYRIFPIEHMSKLKPVRTFPDRPKVV
ncbi:LOW QUALITY PROTEIN: hypothetical protein PHMEG_00022620 [Phytophthora megakarya]|uniref:Reverse transcriptase n=1 Tax=Phytophthora megakarya TaxID=4795 RepID=A0A225VIA2_9STRA|nr:LOW QUALITY PROTEIN: hypothetical protein PHMEG_00022620 [Phytophthora megakarya]